MRGAKAAIGIVWSDSVRGCVIREIVIGDNAVVRSKESGGVAVYAGGEMRAEMTSTRVEGRITSSSKVFPDSRRTSASNLSPLVLRPCSSRSHLSIVEIHEVIAEFTGIFQQLNRGVQHLHQPMRRVLSFTVVPRLRIEAGFGGDERFYDISVQRVCRLKYFIPILRPAANEIIVFVATNLEAKIVDVRRTS